jgi:integrase
MIAMLAAALHPFYLEHRYCGEVGHHMTKTPGSARAVELRPQSVQALKEQQAASRLKSEFVFCNAVGGPLDRDNVMNRVWYPALMRARIRTRKPYQNATRSPRWRSLRVRPSAGYPSRWGTATPR